MANCQRSRNTAIFFSGALFITLAVTVHFTPYFPSYASFQPSIPNASSPPPFHRDSCTSSLHSIAFRDVRECKIVEDRNTCEKKISWDWVGPCGFRRLSKPDISALLNGSWVVVAGDSQSRMMALALLELVMDSDEVGKIRDDLRKWKSVYSVTVDEIGLKLDFVWAPFVQSLTEFVRRMRTSSDVLPDVMLLGSGLWDMLYVHNASSYGASLRELRSSILALSGDGSEPMGLFWVGLPKLETAKLNTEEKRDIMTEALRDLFSDEVVGSKMLRQYGGGPLWFLDLHSLAESCGARCTSDGVHYDGEVYDAAIQIMFNVLLMKSI